MSWLGSMLVDSPCPTLELNWCHFEHIHCGAKGSLFALRANLAAYLPYQSSLNILLRSQFDQTSKNVLTAVLGIEVKHVKTFMAVSLVNITFFQYYEGNLHQICTFLNVKKFSHCCYWIFFWDVGKNLSVIPNLKTSISKYYWRYKLKSNNLPHMNPWVTNKK